MIRRAAVLLLMLSTMATLAGSFWAMSQSPFAAPVIDRSAQAATLALDRALARKVTLEWLTPRIEDAMARKDVDEVQILLDLAIDHDVSLPQPLLLRMAALAKAQSGVWQGTVDCASCALDIATCKDLSHIAACAVPVELTPLGDLNALRRAGLDWASGNEIDQIDAGLAVAGLAATGLTLATGGTSYSVKLGASLIRAGRRLGTVTPQFVALLARLSDGVIDTARMPDYLLGRVPLEAVADTARLGAIGDLAGDFGTVAARTSTAQALVLMRYVDSAADARGLARVATAKGARIRHTYYALGKARTLRALVRLSNLALLTLGLLGALALQLLALLQFAIQWMLRD